VWNEEGAAVSFTLAPYFYQTSWFVGICILLALGGSWKGLLIYQAYQQRKLVASELETQLAKAQLQTLRMQLQPHFLFNTINGIMVLIQRDPLRARAMLSRMSDLLRLTLDHDASREVPLKEEIAVLRKYLDIERTRFRDRLSIEIRVGRELQNALVPTFILQPLVENCIKHGVSKVPGPALIAISARRENGSLKLTVKDNGSGIVPGRLENSEGIGLKNTRARLERMFGSDARLVIAKGASKGLEASVILPFRLDRTNRRKNVWND
jgi:LytS/YehU family sensor histidine kinase